MLWLLLGLGGSEGVDVEGAFWLILGGGEGCMREGEVERERELWRVMDLILSDQWGVIRSV